MINLNDYSSKIENFIQDSIYKFQNQQQMPATIGIYCCPWAEWLTINFNISLTQGNCPDFEFVEFDVLELVGWQNEYEKDFPEFKIDGLIKRHNHNFGDEHFNKLVFEFLKPIVSKLKKKYNSTFLLQMLDSRYVEILN